MEFCSLLVLADRPEKIIRTCRHLEITTENAAMFGKRQIESYKLPWLQMEISSFGAKSLPWPMKSPSSWDWELLMCWAICLANTPVFIKLVGHFPPPPLNKLPDFQEKGRLELPLAVHWKLLSPERASFHYCRDNDGKSLLVPHLNFQFVNNYIPRSFLRKYLVGNDRWCTNMGKIVSKNVPPLFSKN